MEEVTLGIQSQEPNLWLYLKGLRKRFSECKSLALCEGSEMRRALVCLFILLMSVVFAENVAADSLFVDDVTSDSVALRSAVNDSSVKHVVLYVDDGDGWKLWEYYYYWQPDECKVTDLEPDKTYRIKLRYCRDLGCGDSWDSNVVEVTTKETPSIPLLTILAVVSVIVSLVVVMLIALRKRRAERD